MLITEVLGNLGETGWDNPKIDWLELEWEELNKRILRKNTAGGFEIALSFDHSGILNYGDILFEDDERIVVVRTKLEKVYVVKPDSMQQMGKTAFEIGNRHTPCIIDGDEILVRYDHTLGTLLDEVGVNYEVDERRFKESFKYKGHQH